MKVSKVSVWSTGNVAMVAMAAPRGSRIRYTRLLVHLVDGDLAGGVEEGGDSSDRCFHGVVDLVQSTYYNLVSKDLEQFKGSMAATAALGRWSLGARARRLPVCHQQRQAGSDGGAATAARRRLAPAAVVVARWSKDLDVIFIMFEMFCTACELNE